MKKDSLHPLRGIITAMVTPLDEKNNLDEKGLERLIEHLIGGGVHGIFVLGTTGEAPHLTYDVRSALIEQACKLAGSRVPVIVGITDTSYRDAIRMANKSYESGAFAVVAAPPYYFEVGQADLLHYFRKLASEVPLPLFLYNAPLNTHLRLEPATVLKAAAEPNIIGYKDSGLNMGSFHAVREGVRSTPEFTLLVGPEDLLAEAAATLGTRTKKDTVTVALQKVSEDARARRASALADLLAVADAGGFDYSRLDDLDQ